MSLALAAVGGDPDSHNFAVKNGCNLMVTPLMKGDEEMVDLKNTLEAALANNPDVPRPQLMVLRHTHVHSMGDPEGWKPDAAAISRFYRTFDAWFGNKQPRSTASCRPARKRCSGTAPNSSWRTSAFP